MILLNNAEEIKFFSQLKIECPLHPLTKKKKKNILTMLGLDILLMDMEQETQGSNGQSSS